MDRVTKNDLKNFIAEGGINWKKIVEINSGKKKNKELIY